MINKYYLHQDVFPDLRQAFQREQSLQLRHILENDVYIKFLDRVKRLYYHHLYDPLYYSYALVPFHDKKFLLPLHDFICRLADRQLPFPSVHAFCFQHQDYTLLNDELHELPGLSVFLELTPRWNEDYGGYTSFIRNNQEILRMLPHADCLTLMTTSADLKRFVKYVNHTAERHKRYFLELRYEYA